MSKDNAIIAYALYRVSTKGQVDKVKDDIPMQREACHEFAEKIYLKCVVRSSRLI